MTTTTETQVPELTALDTAGISHLAWMISEHAVEGTPIEEMNAELYDALTNYFTDPENRLLARFMARPWWSVPYGETARSDRTTRQSGGFSVRRSTR